MSSGLSSAPDVSYLNSSHGLQHHHRQLIQFSLRGKDRLVYEKDGVS
jgi:hypothetical protein